jgi:hypothetical protein
VIVFLDTGVLGLITNPNSHEIANECVDWLYNLLSKGVYVATSDICDYEVRRGLILAQVTSSGGSGIHLLDQYRQVFDFLPVTTEVFAEASSLWALARSKGDPNAPKENIDVDIILCGQWKVLKRAYPGRRIVIATENLKDFRLYSEADNWRNIYF